MASRNVINMYIDKEMINLFAEAEIQLRCLRDKKSKRIVAISYSDYGIKITCGNSPKLIYYTNAYLKVAVDENNKQFLYVKGDKTVNQKYEIVNYSPCNHITEDGEAISSDSISLQSAELTFLKKALILYSARPKPTEIVLLDDVMD